MIQGTRTFMENGILPSNRTLWNATKNHHIFELQLEIKANILSFWESLQGIWIFPQGKLVIEHSILVSAKWFRKILPSNKFSGVNIYIWETVNQVKVSFKLKWFYFFAFVCFFVFDIQDRLSLYIAVAALELAL